MRRVRWFSLVSCFAVPAVASAANDYAAAHAVLYIPVESITLVPASVCPIPQGGQDNPGLGCSNAVSEETMFEPVANIDEIVAGVTDALAPYNVIVTTTRPEPYVPYQLLIPQDSDHAKSTSATCVQGWTDCDGIDRHDIVFTVGSTITCTDPDPVRTALVAFGRMSGLEGKDNPMDVMGYPPDFATPVTTFVDQCDVIVTPVNPDTMMPMSLQCPSSYHENAGMCATDQHQNSHLELLAVYGPADPAVVNDATPPEIGEVEGLPDDGAVLPSGSEIDLAATITDDSGVVAVRMTYESPAFEAEFGVPGGVVSKCTAGSCGVEGMSQLEFPNGSDMAYPDQSQPWTFDELPQLPDGDYTLTIEASDLAGNVVVPLVRTFSIGDGVADTGGDPTGDPSDDGGTTDDGGPLDTGVDATGNVDSPPAEGDDSDSDDGDDTDGGTDDEGGTYDEGGASNDIIDRGCGCTTNDRGDAALWLFGIAGLALARRRKHA